MKLSAIPLLCAVSLSAAACASAPTAPEPRARARQPLPAEVQRRLETVRGEREGYPSFADIPFTPGDVRSPAQFREAVQAVRTEAASVQTWIAQHPAEITDAEAYAVQARRELGVGPNDIPPADQRARIEALARELRRRAQPPPPLPE